jgi:hypothetical protein
MNNNMNNFQLSTTVNRKGANISILDINIAPIPIPIPIPIAMTVVDDDYVLFGEDTARRYIEEQRIMSMWDDYQYQVLQYA